MRPTIILTPSDLRPVAVVDYATYRPSRIHSASLAAHCANFGGSQGAALTRTEAVDALRSGATACHCLFRSA